MAYYGTGTFTQSGGTNTINDAIDLGVYGNGTYNLSGNGQLLLARQRVPGLVRGGTFTSRAEPVVGASGSREEATTSFSG